MSFEPLVDTGEAIGWGFDVSYASLKRASARIRGYLGQDVAASTSTITARGPVFRLPQRPVVAVASVVDIDAAPVEYELSGSVITTDNLGIMTVTFSHGYIELPDELVELVCQVASRLETPNASLAAGVQTEGTGPFSVGYGWDAWKAQSGLTQGEKDTLDRYWPSLPQIISMGRP